VQILADENVHMGIIHRLRQNNYEVLSVRDVGLSGHKDREILEYSEEYNLILISGDKDFGGLIEFGTLWGQGKVILLRYHLIKIERIAKDIIKTIKRETEIFNSEESAIIVFSESEYRIHRPTTR
jgi:predicted nuclease of predicted toxin-antitoxin system